MSFLDLYLNHTPYISSPTEKNEPSAIIYGIPFDSTHSFRPGTRFGPDSIRSFFNNIEIFMPQFQIDLENVDIKDLGNTKLTVNPNEMLEMAKKVTSELINKSKILIVMGGEHLITLGTYPCFPKKTGFVVFDAHYDLRDQYADTKLSHAAYLRRIVENHGPDEIIHVGARAFVNEELEFKEKHGLKTITDKEIQQGKGPQLLKDAVSVFDTIYVSTDLDVLDPAFGPGVGNPEALGITSRELFDMVYSLSDKKITGADIVELCPPYDNGSTASLAARLISVLIGMNVK